MLMWIFLAFAASSASAASSSAFNRKIDIEKLEADYDEEEGAEWHEDTWEWEAYRNQRDFENMDFAQSATLNRDVMLKKAQKNPERIRLCHVYLAQGTCQSKVDCAHVAVGWQAFLLSGGRTSVKVASPKNDRIIVEMISGDFSAAKDAILEIKDVERVWWNEHWLYPDSDLGQRRKDKDQQAEGYRLKQENLPDDW